MTAMASDGLVVPAGWVAIGPLHRVVLKFLKGKWARGRSSGEPANGFVGVNGLYDQVPEFAMVGLPLATVMAPLRAAWLVEDGARYYGPRGRMWGSRILGCCACFWG